jgi:membrane protein DedA with SNARE-associated domain
MSHIHWRFFAIWNVIAALIWSIIFSGVGYFFGDVVATLSGDSLKSNMHEIFFLTLVLLGTFFIFQQLIAHLHRKSA